MQLSSAAAIVALDSMSRFNLCKSVRYRQRTGSALFVLLQRLGGDLLELRGNVGIQAHWRQPARGSGFASGDQRRGIAAERLNAGSHLSRAQSERKQIGARIQLFARTCSGDM